MDVCYKQCLNLPKGEDDDDDQGWLLLDLLVRSLQRVDKMHEPIVTFSSAFCNLALQICIGDEFDWDEKLQRSALAMVQSMDKNRIVMEEHILLRYKTLAMAEIALGVLTKPNSIVSDGPRYLATVRIASFCELVGIELFVANIQKSSASPINRGFCESDSEAKMLYNHFESLCNICNHLKRSITSVLVNAYMRRVKEFVILLAGYYDKKKSSVSSWDKSRKSGKQRQSLMSAFIKDKEEDEDEEDSEDETDEEDKDEK